MSFPKYERYKDSGIEWLGEVPEHWKITRIKFVSSFHTGWTPPTGKDSNFEGDNLWANISDLGEKIIFDVNKRISDDAIKSSGMKISLKGNLLFSFKLSIGQVSFVGNNMYTNEAIATFHKNAKICLEYAYYSYPLFIVKNASENIYGAKILNQELIRGAALLLPPLPEQQTIATFLDHETAKIDDLIAEQQRLITLLMEKRQAVISHAVTKGLNPDAPMKDSGVEWLGEVPEHWIITVAKRVADIFIPQRNKPELNLEADGTPWITMEDMKQREILSASLWVSDESSRISGSRILEKNSVIASCVGTFGVSSVNRIEVIINQQLQAFIPGFNINSEYLCLFVQCMKDYFYSIGTSATIAYVNQHGFENMPLTLPSIDEQIEIVDFVDTEIGKFGDQIGEVQRGIELLQERRSALISAAVSGKIDVRGVSKNMQE